MQATEWDQRVGELRLRLGLDSWISLYPLNIALEDSPTFKIWSNWPVVIGWLQPAIIMKIAYGFMKEGLLLRQRRQNG